MISTLIKNIPGSFSLTIKRPEVIGRVTEEIITVNAAHKTFSLKYPGCTIVRIKRAFLLAIEVWRVANCYYVKFKGGFTLNWKITLLITLVSYNVIYCWCKVTVTIF